MARLREGAYLFTVSQVRRNKRGLFVIGKISKRRKSLEAAFVAATKPVPKKPKSNRTLMKALERGLLRIKRSDVCKQPSRRTSGKSKR